MKNWKEAATNNNIISDRIKMAFTVGILNPRPVSYKSSALPLDQDVCPIISQIVCQPLRFLDAEYVWDTIT